VPPLMVNNLRNQLLCYSQLLFMKLHIEKQEEGPNPEEKTEVSTTDRRRKPLSSVLFLAYGAGAGGGGVGGGWFGFVCRIPISLITLAAKYSL